MFDFPSLLNRTVRTESDCSLWIETDGKERWRIERISASLLNLLMVTKYNVLNRVTKSD